LTRFVWTCTWRNLSYRGQIQSACADFLDLPSSKETLFPEDGDQIFNRVSAGAADGIIGQDIDKVYSSKNPGWKAGTSITKSRPTVLGFEEFVAQEHPEGFSNFRDSAASQACHLLGSDVG
jgi:hypothetical protein